jgi:hypothetical protein
MNREIGNLKNITEIKKPPEKVAFLSGLRK